MVLTNRSARQIMKDLRVAKVEENVDTVDTANDLVSQDSGIYEGDESKKQI